MSPETRKVLTQFLQDEFASGKHPEALKDLDQWIRLGDDEFLEQVQSYAEARSDRHPIFAYALGPLLNTERTSLTWKNEVIPLSQIHFSSTSSELASDLNDVGFNLVRFARERAVKHSRFKSTFHGSKLPTLILMVDNNNERHQRYRILDGAKRAVALVRMGGIFDVRAWVGTRVT